MEKILNLLLQTRVIWRVQVKDKPKYHPELTSGQHSDLYVNVPKLLESPNITRMFLESCVTQETIKKMSECEYIVGIESGGVPLAYVLPSIFPQLSTCKVLFIPKNYRKKAYWNFSNLNGKVFLVDDVVTTGSTIARVTEERRLRLKNVKGVFCLFNRSEDQTLFIRGWKLKVYPCLNVKPHTWSKFNCPLCKQGSKAVRPKQKWDYYIEQTTTPKGD